VTRKSSRVAFTFVVASASAITCITLYSLIAGFSRFETVFLLVGFFEVRRIASGSNSIAEREAPDPDVSRVIVAGPPTGQPYPHHEHYPESAGFDQGQLTSRLPDQPPVRIRLPWRRPHGDETKAS
jgi:hypothetical protein